jgi:hypothetical protein
MNWFSHLNGKEDVEYNMFSYVGGKHLIYKFCVDGLEVFYMSPRMLSKRLWPRWKMNVKGVAQGLVYKLEQHIMEH